MVFPSHLSSILAENEPLAMHTSWGVGGPAAWMARPQTTAQLSELVSHCRRASVEFYTLGLGANLLVSDDGVDGVVIRLRAPDFRSIRWGRDGQVAAGAGVDMNRLALDAVRRGWSGLECMAGIPGTLGGIIRMNAGGRHGQIADVVTGVTVMEPTGRIRELSPAEVGFRYRGTNLGDSIICRATLGLKPGDPEVIRKQYLAVWDDKKSSQPLAKPTAGCVFKNPPGRSAGALIDQAGLKGRRVGGAYVSECHANFIVTEEGATAQDVLALIGLIRREVAQTFGVELELEVQIWGHRRARSVETIA